MSDKASKNGSELVRVSNAFAEADAVIMEEDEENVECSASVNDGNDFSNVIRRCGSRILTAAGRESNETIGRGSQETACTDGSEGNEEDDHYATDKEDGNRGDAGMEVENGNDSTPSKKRTGRKTKVTYVPREGGQGKQYGIMECTKCGKLFSRKTMVDRHNASCTENKERKRGDAIEISIEKAFDVVYEDHTAGLYTRHSVNPELAKIGFRSERDCITMRRGWACRPKWVTALGENTIEEFKPCLKAWFDTRSAHPEKKMSAARILNKLQAMNPYRYDLTTENQIQSYISHLSGEEKKKRMKAATKRIMVRESAKVPCDEDVRSGEEAGAAGGDNGVGRNHVNPVEGGDIGRSEDGVTGMETERDRSESIPFDTSSRDGSTADAFRGSEVADGVTENSIEPDATLESVRGAQPIVSAPPTVQINVAARREAGRHGAQSSKYRWPAKYVDALKRVLRDDFGIKGVDVRTKMVSALGL